jgi:D-threo-aldose 1-dehydrogenase
MNGIPTRRIGTTNLQVAELGFGSASLGNLYRPISDADARAALDAAVAAGLTYIDTAPHYGRGLSERRVGDAVRLRQDVTLSTKVGRLMVPDASIIDDRMRDGFRSPMPFKMRYDYSYDGVFKSYEESLQRLGVGSIDLLYVHDIGSLTHGEKADHVWKQLTEGGGLEALEELRDEGSIKGFGIGVNEIAICLDVMEHARLDAILLAGRYTLLEQEALDTLLPRCAEAGTSIVIGGPYNSGILATGTKGGGTIFYDYGAAPQPVIDKVAQIEAIAEQHGVPLPAAALAFVLAHPQVASVIPGMGHAKRVQQTLDLYHHHIPADFWAELRHERLIREDAPTP